MCVFPCVCVRVCACACVQEPAAPCCVFINSTLEDIHGCSHLNGHLRGPDLIGRSDWTPKANLPASEPRAA